MLDERGEISPFGWGVGVANRPPEQVERVVEALIEDARSAWTRSFPPERGYEICVEARPGMVQGVHLTAQRGDFRAEATVEHESIGSGARAAVSSGPSVRAFGRARMASVVEALRRGERFARRGSVAGVVTGLSVFFTLAWLMIGVNDPIYVLGGMLLAVALLTSLMVGALLGGWLGERVGHRHRLRAQRDARRTPGFEDDVRRWKALSRQLLAQRGALCGGRGQPFRREPSLHAP